jgi:hypothetical protein
MSRCDESYFADGRQRFAHFSRSVDAPHETMVFVLAKFL